jgi:hypothetical protein
MKNVTPKRMESPCRSSPHRQRIGPDGDGAKPAPPSGAVPKSNQEAPERELTGSRSEVVHWRAEFGALMNHFTRAR